MQCLKQGGIRMNKQTMDATPFEYSISYFNNEFEDVLKKIIICYNLMTTQNVILPNDENKIRNELTFNYLNKNEVRKQIGISNYLIQVATYIGYNLSNVYAQMKAISLIKNPFSVTA
jgi:hypothetical protein